MTLINLVVFYF